MTSDPAFGLLLCAPIFVVALAALIVARPNLPFALAIAVCAVAACGVGWRTSGAEAARSAANVSAELESTAASAAAAAAPAAAPTPLTAAFTSAQLALALHPTRGGDVAVDAFDTVPNGARRVAGLFLNSGQTLHVTGWAYVTSNDRPCRAVGLMIDGKALVPGRYGYPRPDVAAAYRAPSRQDVGYSIDAAAHDLRAGTHVGRVVCIGDDVARENDAALHFKVRLK
jgi:hypothetical protein